MAKMKKTALFMLTSICLLPLAAPVTAATPRWGWSAVVQHSMGKTLHDNHLTAVFDFGRRPPVPVGPNGPERPAFVRVLESGFFTQRRVTRPALSNANV